MDWRRLPSWIARHGGGGGKVVFSGIVEYGVEGSGEVQQGDLLGFVKIGNEPEHLVKIDSGKRILVGLWTSKGFIDSVRDTKVLIVEVVNITVEGELKRERCHYAGSDMIVRRRHKTQWFGEWEERLFVGM